MGNGGAAAMKPEPNVLAPGKILRTILSALWCVAATEVVGKPAILKATRPVVSVQEGSALRKDAWRLAPEAKPDVYEVELKDGKPLKVTFISDVDSISFEVEEGEQYDFIIQHGDDLCQTRIVGLRAIPAAVFDAAYRAAHTGKISVEIPEVYELVSIALAMTPALQADRSLVYHDSDYYAAMRKWFDPFAGHPAIAELGAALAQNPGLYASLKMNGYAFEFDEEGRLTGSAVYDRTAFPNEKRNALRPFIGRLQSFADASRFRAFYEENRSTYARQIAFYTQDADLEGMRSWLIRNFPGPGGGYDSYKIIFSPLVAYNQSATWMESNGFKELQAHVNFPYPQDVTRLTNGVALSPRSETLLRGAIVFTEMNHGFINPEADKYAARVLQATCHRDRWVDPSKGPGYYGGISAFDEYMNWGLVSLRAVDLAPAEDRQALISIVDAMMTGRRGFPQFAAFDAFLVDLYVHRKPGQPIAELYPRIIQWFEEHDR
jgi:hypothetical protein